MHCCKFSIYLPWVEIVKISTIPSIECEEEYIKIKNRIKNFIDKFINEIQSSIPNPKFQRERERLTISWNKRQKLKNTFPYRFLKESNSICSMFTLLLSILILCLAFFVIAHQSVVCWLLSFHLHLRLIFIYSPFLSFFLFFFLFSFWLFLPLQRFTLLLLLLLGEWKSKVYFILHHLSFFNLFFRASTAMELKI